MVLTATYLAEFLADGRPVSIGIIADALANALAAAAAAVPVIWFCAKVRWDRAGAWWFPLAHLAVGGAFGLLWYGATALALGLSAGLQGGAWMPRFLQGPALRWEEFTTTVLYVAVAGGCYAVQAAAAAREAMLLRHQAEVAALRAQLDPHLLFNTLHSLLELVRSGDARADEALDRFARVVRYVCEGRTAGASVTLAEEWAMMEDYVALESLRLGPRITVSLSMDTLVADARIPALSLQPLVENAFRHGVVPRPGPGEVTVRAWRGGSRVHLAIHDDGLGAATTTHGAGTGLTLVRKRLEARFGPALDFSAGPDAGGWRVTMSFPCTAQA